MQRAWRFDSLSRTDPNGRNPIFGNFKNEGYTDCQTFVREFLQNTLDNRRKQEGGLLATARVEFRLLSAGNGLDAAFLKGLLSSLEPHLVASGVLGTLRDYAQARVLVVEEFETTGFGGPYEDSRAEGDFAGFFHGEAHDTKTGGKNGRAGQGKATYNMISHAGAFMALTLREEDDLRLLMGKALVPKTHQVSDRYYKFRGFWSDWVTLADGDEQPIPFLDQALQNQVASAFGLQRSGTQYGSSFVIPFPKREVTEDLIKQVVLEEYFYSIIKGRLEVKVGHTLITAATLFELIENSAPSISSAHQPPSPAFMRFVEAATRLSDEVRCEASKRWDGAAQMPGELFEQELLSRLEERFAQGEIAWARLPVTVIPRLGGKQQSHFDIFLQHGGEIVRTEEAFIRRDLYIARERHVRGAFGQVHVLVIAEDEIISDYLAYAEVASHLSWNGSEEKLTERYHTSDTLRAVRTGARRMIELLQGAEEEVSTDLLIDLLSIPSDPAANKGKQTGPTGKDKVRPPIPEPPAPGPQYHRVTDGIGVRVEAASDPLPSLPISATLEVAYENTALGGNAFKNYHPFDFDLYDALAHKVTCNGISLQSRSENKVQFTINQQDWFLEVGGFDQNKPVRARALLEI